jgi:hypothetical protein
MRSTKSCIYSGLVILAVAGIGVFAVLHSRNQAVRAHACINNLRAMDAADFEQMEKQDALVLSLVPLGTTFSKAVAVLGGNYSTSKTNTEASFYVNFNGLLPGMTNRPHVTFLVRSNVIVWAGYIAYSTGLPEPQMTHLSSLVETNSKPLLYEAPIDQSTNAPSYVQEMFRQMKTPVPLLRAYNLALVELGPAKPQVNCLSAEISPVYNRWEFKFIFTNAPPKVCFMYVYYNGVVRGHYDHNLTGNQGRPLPVSLPVAYARALAALGLETNELGCLSARTIFDIYGDAGWAFTFNPPNESTRAFFAIFCAPKAPPTNGIANANTLLTAAQAESFAGQLAREKGMHIYEITKTTEDFVDGHWMVTF